MTKHSADPNLAGLAGPPEARAVTLPSGVGGADRDRPISAAMRRHLIEHPERAEALVEVLIAAAMRGDLRAAELVIAASGGKLTQRELPPGLTPGPRPPPAP